MAQNIVILIRKEARLEWRYKNSLSGILLYLVSTVFICYLSFRQIVDVPTWNALFWIIILFAAVNSVAKSFLGESRGLQLFQYSFLNPADVIISKIIYHGFFLFALSCAGLILFIFFTGNLINDMHQFVVALFLGSTGFSSVLTMISAIASRAGSSPALLPVLGFPIVLPLLSVTIRFSKNAADGLAWSVSNQYMFILIALNLLVAALAYILFPYLWRE